MQQVNNVIVSSLGAIPEAQAYDLGICALGFESRCTSHAQLLRRQAAVQYALGFTHGQNKRYQEHKKVFASLDIQIREPEDAEFKQIVKQLFIDVTDNSGPIRVCADISSMSRRRIAAILEAAEEHSATVSIDFIYSIAAFSPPVEFEGLTMEIGPVSPRFSGWSSYPDSDLDCIVGLGFEAGRAIGAIDVIEATRVHVFNPRSSLKEYETEVLRANVNLLDVQGVNEWINYDLCLPYQLFEKLEAMVAMKRGESNVVIFPFGPKIFALVSLIVGLIHPEVSIWRISHGKHTPDGDRKPSGITTHLRVAFQKPVFLQQPTLAEGAPPIV